MTILNYEMNINLGTAYKQTLYCIQASHQAYQLLEKIYMKRKEGRCREMK